MHFFFGIDVDDIAHDETQTRLFAFIFAGSANAWLGARE